MWVGRWIGDENNTRLGDFSMKKSTEKVCSDIFSYTQLIEYIHNMEKINSELDEAYS